jgi:D-alanine-D-alanine ligase
MKILVLAGGLSPERNVSLSSGAMVTQALRGRGHQVALVDLFFGLEGADGTKDPFQAPIPESFKKVSRQAPDLKAVRASRRDQSASVIGPGVLELCRQADVVYLALHGACGEDGRLQAALDLMGVPYTGSGYLASAIAMDKDLTKRLVCGQVTTPSWQSVAVSEENLEQLTAQTQLPVVVKPIDSGSSIGVYIARDRQELRQALKESVKLGGRTVLEQYISGREIQVAILEDRALPSIEIIPKEGFYDYENKYQPGAALEVCPAQIPPEWEKRVGDAALTVFRTVGLAVYARADFIVTQDGTPYFLEINTLPGMTPTSLVPQEAAAVGIDYATLCETIIQASLKARKEGV